MVNPFPNPPPVKKRRHFVKGWKDFFTEVSKKITFLKKNASNRQGLIQLAITQRNDDIDFLKLINASVSANAVRNQ